MSNEMSNETKATLESKLIQNQNDMFDSTSRKMFDVICQLAESSYMENIIRFEFRPDRYGHLKMYPCQLVQVGLIGRIKDMFSKEDTTKQPAEEICETFNELINNNGSYAGEFSRNQREVLRRLKRMLKDEGFDVIVSPTDGFTLQWGDDDI